MHASRKKKRSLRALFASGSFWTWLLLSVLYGGALQYFTHHPEPQAEQIKQAWIYDNLSLIATTKNARGGVVEIKSLFRYVSEDEFLKLIDDYWKKEYAAHKRFYRSDPPFKEALDQLNKKYRDRIEQIDEDKGLNGLLVLQLWLYPVIAGLIGILTVFFRAKPQRPEAIKRESARPQETRQ